MAHGGRGTGLTSNTTKAYSAFIQQQKGEGTHLREGDTSRQWSDGVATSRSDHTLADLPNYILSLFKPQI